MEQMMEQNKRTTYQTLAVRCAHLSAGCDVDCEAVERHGVDLPTLRRLAEAYRAGWLHNVMSRITPLTLRKREDYMVMADVFTDTKEVAARLLDKFQTDIELFCQMAGITVTEHMTADSVSPELSAHVELYKDIAKLFEQKFDLTYQDPIQAVVASPLHDACNPFVVEFMDTRFPNRGMTDA